MTTFPQLIHILYTWGAPLSVIGLYGYVLWLRRVIAKEYPSKSLLHELRLEISSLTEQTEALYDRFTRFQKREGMRDARQEKTRQADIQREAQEILAALPQQRTEPEDGTPFSNKLGLYRRRH